jgi:hypothetical protein
MKTNPPSQPYTTTYLTQTRGPSAEGSARERSHLWQKTQLGKDGPENHSSPDAEHARGDGADKDEQREPHHLVHVPLHVALYVLVPNLDPPPVRGEPRARGQQREKRQHWKVEEDRGPIAERAAADAQQGGRAVPALEQGQQEDRGPRANKLKRRLPLDAGFVHLLPYQRLDVGLRNSIV